MSGPVFPPLPAAWRLADAGALPELRPWTDGWLVFNPLSGHSHLLDEVSGHLLSVLSSGPGSVAALYADVSRLLELPCDAVLAARVDELLAQLDELGLVEPVAAC